MCVSTGVPVKTRLDITVEKNGNYSFGISSFEAINRVDGIQKRRK